MADHGNEDAIIRLGQLYYRGEGVKKDDRKAVEIYTDAYNRGYYKVGTRLGVCYLYESLGVDKDEKKAFKIFVKCAENGDSDAMYHLGDCYQDGIGISDLSFGSAKQLPLI